VSTEGEESVDEEKCWVPCLSPMTGELPCSVSFPASKTLQSKCRMSKLWKTSTESKNLASFRRVCSVYKVMDFLMVARDLIYVSFPVLYSYKDKHPTCLRSTSDVLVHTVVFC